MSAFHAALRREALRPEDLAAFASRPEHGAVAAFVGIVRNSHEGKPVVAVTYDAFEPLAAKVLAEIAEEAASRSRARVAVEHRVGRLAVGEASVAIAAGAPHREAAFDACRRVIEEIKLRLPVWKREHYPDGESAWLPGCSLAHREGS